MIAKIYIYSIFHISRYITNTKTFASKQTTKIIEYVIYLCLVNLLKYCGKKTILFYQLTKSTPRSKARPGFKWAHVM